MLRVRVSLLLVFVTALIARQTNSAADQFQHLRTRLRESHSANDWHSNLAAASEQKRFLHKAPNSLLEIARADVHLGKFTAAFRELEQFVRLGQTTGPLTSAPDFTVLRNDAHFAKLQQAMQAIAVPYRPIQPRFSFPNRTC